jgi:hypothetical protein
LVSEPLKMGRKRAVDRAVWDKEGKYKYIVHLLREIRRELNALKVTQRYMVRGLEHEFLFDQEYVEDVACSDEVDRAIIEELHHAGPYGILPRDVANRLKKYRLKPWNVTQRIRRMNKKLDRLIGQKAAEKRGKGWALTTFLREAWGSTENEMLTSVTEAT